MNTPQTSNFDAVSYGTVISRPTNAAVLSRVALRGLRGAFWVWSLRTVKEKAPNKPGGVWGFKGNQWTPFILRVPLKRDIQICSFEQVWGWGQASATQVHAEGDDCGATCV